VGVCSAEFEYLMKTLKEKMDSDEMQDRLRRGERWRYSWDNDKIHQGADIAKMGIREDERFELPELSSDMHKVVEHVHAWLQRRMGEWMEEKDDEKITVVECMAELRRLFEQELSLESIRDNVKSLKATYKAVIYHRGGYITAGDR
jgi:hypothetical protein